MRRQTLFGGLDPAWHAGPVRLDPNDLPVRVAVSGDAAPGNVSPVATIGADAVTIARAANGPFLKVPVKSYEAVLLADNASAQGGAGVVLFHENEELNVPLCIANDGADLEEDWHAWGDVLDRPLVYAQTDGRMHAAESRLGALTVSRPRARRANTFFEARRPAFLTKREMGDPDCIRIHAREAEIIARD